MTATELAALVGNEVIALHVEFQQWFRGDGENLNRVEAVLTDDFTFISPRGDVVTVDALLDGLHSSRGSSDITIRIENPVVRWRAAHAVIATYEEWHDHDEYTTARLTTAVFSIDESAPGGLKWRHVHETWIKPPPTWVVPERNG